MYHAAIHQSRIYCMCNSQEAAEGRTARNNGWNGVNGMASNTWKTCVSLICLPFHLSHSSRYYEPVLKVPPTSCCITLAWKNGSVCVGKHVNLTVLMTCLLVSCWVGGWVVPLTPAEGGPLGQRIPSDGRLVSRTALVSHPPLPYSMQLSIRGEHREGERGFSLSCSLT